mmetsp:Transcript_13044/g.39752  ORF Transcript_13044/g.39752 Transcript_13044/m.39752 type:complete len:251 (-) Transcript_13044:234-986(-)|eukprot:scaffold186528_cov30-Tisochrysis_lutea.AAC.2
MRKKSAPRTALAKMTTLSAVTVPSEDGRKAMAEPSGASKKAEIMPVPTLGFRGKGRLAASLANSMASALGRRRSVALKDALSMSRMTKRPAARTSTSRSLPSSTLSTLATSARIAEPKAEVSGLALAEARATDAVPKASSIRDAPAGIGGSGGLTNSTLASDHWSHPLRPMGLILKAQPVEQRSVLTSKLPSAGAGLPSANRHWRCLVPTSRMAYTTSHSMCGRHALTGHLSWNDAELVAHTCGPLPINE